VPERLREPHVPDPGDQPLIEERFGDELRLVEAAEATDDVGDLGLLGEQVRPEPADRTLVEREDGTVPLLRFPRRATQDEPGTAAAGGAAPLEPPAAAHPEVAANDDAALEAKEEMLADRLDSLQDAPVDGRGHTCREPLRMGALRVDALTDERLQKQRDATEGVAFGHASGGERGLELA
jgi:hypothetical protein